ncbi:sensor histidine kinase [Kribbella jiaozuonensis]|uniref:histidine kinase n=1 Tax=Kribbella jiaozuonensis TaxID=2575441 RepID=A0A4U3LKJ6_9ACTN|nr:HAMP domain-containing sensor histidine kinase [Kribbella jiaozuonensis]TKK76110.1 HAMP domain-containing histidine kinase [Kribbella jiaozuonensis]
MTLRWRIALILAAVALGVGAFAGASAYLTTSSQIHSSIDDNLRSRAEATNTVDGERGRPHGGDGPDSRDCPPAGSFQPASAAQIIGTDGAVTSCIEGGVALPTVASDLQLTAGTVVLRTISVQNQPYRVLATPWHDGGTLQIARSLSESNALLSRLRWQLLALIGAAMLLTAGLGWAIATRLARPIVRLRDATENIATTLDLTSPMEVGGTGEVRGLTASFATMIEAVRKSQEKQRRLVSDAGHEMRTPLTSLRSNVELLRKIERLPEGERREVVNDVLEDIDELSALLGELVDLASDLAATEPAEPLSLGDLARTVATRMSRRSGRAILVDDSAAQDVVGRPRQLDRAISNLVDNAIKYSDGAVEIEVKGTGLTVHDRGRGIAAADLDRIFDRFYRAVEVRTEPGSGLGLAIVEEIVHSHGGQVFAHGRDGGGSSIGFTLPEPV